MAKYFHSFETVSEFNNAYNGDGYLEPWVSRTEENEKVDYNKSNTPVPPIDYRSMPLTLEVTNGSGVLGISIPPDAGQNAHLYYSLNDGEYVQAIDGEAELNVVANDVIRLKGYDCGPEIWSSRALPMFYKRQPNGLQIIAYGNIMSILRDTGFENLESFPGYFGFRALFSGFDCLVDARNLILPATELIDYCYWQMFDRCVNLMAAPELPATTLSQGCYKEMFYDCTSLNYVKCLALKTSGSGSGSEESTDSWLYDVPNSGTFVKNPASTVSAWGRGDDGIPYGWTVEDAN